jgi:quinol monooxygenase YgiN
MIIAVVDLVTSASDRALALARLDGERDAVRAMPGNVSYRVYASREDEEQTTLIHAWQDESALAGYLASDVFAGLGAVLRPVMTGAPVSRRFRVETMETIA